MKMEPFIINPPLDVIWVLPRTLAGLTGEGEAHNLPNQFVFRLAPASSPMQAFPGHYIFSILECDGVQTYPITFCDRAQHTHAHKVLGGDLGLPSAVR